MKSILIAFVLMSLAGGSRGAGTLQSHAVPPAPTAAETLLNLIAPKVLNAACCKTCRKGKACGDSCISRDKSCSKAAGCACDG